MMNAKTPRPHTKRARQKSLARGLELRAARERDRITAREDRLSRTKVSEKGSWIGRLSTGTVFSKPVPDSMSALSSFHSLEIISTEELAEAEKQLGITDLRSLLEQQLDNPLNLLRLKYFAASFDLEEDEWGVVLTAQPDKATAEKIRAEKERCLGSLGITALNVHEGVTIGCFSDISMAMVFQETLEAYMAETSAPLLTFRGSRLRNSF